MVESPLILVTETIACRGSRIPEIIRQKEEGVEGELQCLLMYLEHKQMRNTEAIDSVS